MQIIDFMVSTGDLAVYNYIVVPDTPETMSELKSMGCTDVEIKQLRDDMKDGTLDVYSVLTQKGWLFDIARGFYTCEKQENTLYQNQCH